VEPKNFSPNVESLVCEIGNEIHKTIKVQNIIRIKRPFQVGPGVLVVTHTILSSAIFIGANPHHQSRCIL